MSSSSADHRTSSPPDDAHGGRLSLAQTVQPKENTEREAEVPLDMEEQGRLKGPVRRPVRDDGQR
jgi:hypothetical protein